MFPYPNTGTYRIPNVPVIGYRSVLTKRPDDGSVEPKHVAFESIFNKKLDVFD
jgi:hypothetical protein